MKNKTYFITVSTVFVLVATGHFLRVAFGWPVHIGTWEVPMWFSWLAVIFAGGLAYHGLHINKK